MKRVTLKPGADLDGFRNALRQLIGAQIAPDCVLWESEPGLFTENTQSDAPSLILPRRVVDIIQLVICHRDPERFALLYRLVWRIRHGEPALLEIASDPLIHRLHRMEKSVRRDLHKMHAFVRFRRAPIPDEEIFAAWFEPEHFILEAAAPFFRDRFTSMRWSILTPLGALHWDREQMAMGPPARREDVPQSDDFEAGWRTYYENIFNPARLNPKVMRGHMAKKYWKNMPETRAIPAMVRSASHRVQEMIAREHEAARKRNPDRAVAAMKDNAPPSLEALNRIIMSAPPMVRGGTRAVLGEGPLHPALAFVGEQPGDQEDLQGRPFVGPAGQLLDRAMKETGIGRRDTYVTNAVKHFKFEQRGKLRLHSRPNAGEVKHYRWWLEKELDFVKPGFLVALGGTAALALTGKAVPVLANRGPLVLGGRPGFLTIHPSALLRMPDEEKAQGWAAFVADLRWVRQLVEEKISA